MLAHSGSTVFYRHEYEVDVALTDAGITIAQDYGSVVDLPPTITSTPSPMFTEGVAATYDMEQHWTDDGISTVTSSLSNVLPNGLAYNGSTHILSYDGIASATVSSHQLTATDAVGSDQSASFNISVLAGQLAIGPLPELTAFTSRMTGASAYTFDQDPGAAVSATTFRTAAYVKVASDQPRVFQYDAMLGVRLWRDFMRYEDGTKDGSGNLITPSTTHDSEADQMMDKFQDYQLGYCEDNGFNVTEPHSCAQGFLNAFLDGYSSPIEGQVTLANFTTMTGTIPGDPFFTEQENGTYTDASGATQIQFWMDIHRQRFISYAAERQICSAWAGNANNSIARYDIAAGYGNGADWPVGSPVNNSTITQPRLSWAPHHMEFLFHELKGAATDGPTTSFMPHAPTRKWPTLLTGNNGWRWSPWMTGIMAQNAVLWMEYLEKESLAIDTYWLGTSGFANIFDQLADFYEWAYDTSIVHPSNPTSPGSRMIQTGGDGYEQFRFQDRDWSDGIGINSISTQFGCVYGWLGKQLALGNAALGITQDIPRAEAMFNRGDQVFAAAQDKDPFLNYIPGGIFRLKEHWEIYNPCIKYYFWRLEAQGIDTGRTWV